MMGFLRNYVRNLGSIWLGAEPTRPLLFSYYVTHRCELNCCYCSDGEGRRFKEDPVPELGTADARRLITILREAADTLDITGGEPMLREDLEEILAYARQIGFRTILNTKGIGLPGRPSVLRHTDVLVLSLDSLDLGVLGELIGRPGGTAAAVLESLRWAMGARASTGTRIVLSAVATPANLLEVSRVRQFAGEHSLGFQVSPQIVGTMPHGDLRGNEDYRLLIDATLVMKGRKAGVLGVPEYLRGIRDFGEFGCHPLLMPTIRPDGRMYYPCLESRHAGINLLDAGNYRRALRLARRLYGGIPDCRGRCQIFCHMALSLFQEYPLSALGELRHWRN